MKISTKGRYALRTMIDLALHGGGFIPLKNISERQDITIKYLEQIVTILQRAGLVKSLRGNSGGYKLTRSAEEYTIGDILRTTEGSLVPVGCVENVSNQCLRKDSCLTLPFWQGLGKTIDAYVDSFTLYDLIKNARTEESGDFCI